MTATPHLHLIRCEPPAPRRLKVTISAHGRSGPIGRSRVFRLLPEHIDRLLLEAERLERRV